MFERLLSFVAGRPASPAVHDSFSLSDVAIDHSEDAAAAHTDDELHPIAGFTCVIDYVDTQGEASERLITCKTFEVKGERASICAICHVRNAYRRFIIDRIESVYDARTGELLGNGQYFTRFSVDVRRDEPDPTWGLTRSRKQTLVAGLNALAFMARCDGQWHPLEEPVFTDFILDLWALKGWPGEPPVCAVMDHAHNLAPDQETFFKSLAEIGRSSGTSALLLECTERLIAADGVIAPQEFHWAVEMRQWLEECSERAADGGVTLADMIQQRPQ